LNADVLVSAGGGDNMMGAIGTGNVSAGVITASFGTSGTIYACAEKPVVDPEGEIAAFCDSTNRWLPLLCTMNVTTATEMMRNSSGWTHEKIFRNRRADPGGFGRIAAAALSGRGTDAECAGGDGSVAGDQPEDVFAGTPGARGDGRRDDGDELRFAAAGGTGREARADPGDGRRAKSKAWRQIMADVFNTEVVTLKVTEGAAYGAALQALWCWRQEQGEKVAIKEITDQFIALNNDETTDPDKKNVEIYRELQALQDATSASLREVFVKHRNLCWAKFEERRRAAPVLLH